MKLTGFGPLGKLGHDVELSKQLTEGLTRIVAFAQRFHLFKNSRQRVLGLVNRPRRVILALTLQTLMMLEKFFAVKLSETSARPAVEGAGLTRNFDGQAAL